jgi:hypothetical protein
MAEREAAALQRGINSNSASVTPLATPVGQECAPPTVTKVDHSAIAVSMSTTRKLTPSQRRYAERRLNYLLMVREHTLSVIGSMEASMSEIEKKATEGYVRQQLAKTFEAQRAKNKKLASQLDERIAREAKKLED